MPGTAFPDAFGEEPNAAATEGDRIADELGAILDNDPVAKSQRAAQAAGGAERDLAREEALERLRQQFLGGEIKEEWPPAMKREELVKHDARVQKWADVAMWRAEPHTDPQKPKVTVSMCTPDPLGQMAMVNAQYTGRNLTKSFQVTDEERREAWTAATVSKLSETPLEWIQWSINLENVSRALTHQLVRTRMATYAQESMRFAVVDDINDAVKLPPSLAGTLPWPKFREEMEKRGVDPELNARKEQYWRNIWDNALDVIDTAYANLVDGGMPAEDARGLLPTNMLTRVHVRIDMKTLLNLAGSRLCTQAQFEWRAVFAELAKAIREYGQFNPDTAWQFNLIADSFRPVCFAEGRCPMKAKSDRFCSIQAQVDRYAELGVLSEFWEDDPGLYDLPEDVRPIRPEQWLADPTAARVAPGQEK